MGAPCQCQHRADNHVRHASLNLFLCMPLLSLHAPRALAATADSFTLGAEGGDHPNLRGGHTARNFHGLALAAPNSAPASSGEHRDGRGDVSEGEAPGIRYVPLFLLLCLPCRLLFSLSCSVARFTYCRFCAYFTCGTLRQEARVEPLGIVSKEQTPWSSARTTRGGGRAVWLQNICDA